ncbi:unnamed protein product [Ceutorhynchus assimilis]|uniref:endo-polygalacturonase n=1 Tax=Ceutorhynchus assimilis TaxID=467358 RepID=A0A9N9QPM2_9CUCU|nr:unnamed protein product [Ceutorhynchus assimilis]CAG9768287.1 unnamed protein product [Ceutorhynchus assimilis]
MMSFQVATLVALLAIGAFARPQQQTFSHEGIGYAVLNHTVQPVPDGCTINSVIDVASVVAACTTINVGSFVVPAANQPLIMNLKQGTTLTFTGQINFAKHAFKGYLMEIMGAKINVVGSNTHQLHGHGEQYWDGIGGAGSPKPTFLYLKGTGGSQFTGLHIKNCPERCVAIDGSNDITVSGFLVDNREGAPGKAPKGKEGHNTDGFDVAKTQYLTLKNNVVYNQDDCVAINNGAHMTIDNLNCDGSHGFDIATGMSTTDQSQNMVNNITFKNSKLFNGMYGLHILTCNDGGRGYVKNINYQNIVFNGPSDYGIMVQQDFSNKAQHSTNQPTGNVPISNVQYNGVTGTMNGKFSSALTIRCASGACSNIGLNGVKITGARAPNKCTGYKVNGWC